VNYRKLTELPYHLAQVGDIERLVRVICDFEFIKASFIEHKHFDLLGYLQIAGIHTLILRKKAGYFLS
jgi:hypothetical protein